MSPAPEEEFEEPVIRDRRRIDPTTGRVRPGAPASPAAGTGATAGPPGDAGAAPGSTARTDAGVAPGASTPAGREQELVEDLRRLQAEYVNYKRRVDRDRDVARTLGKVDVVERLLPVLDDIDRAREHGHLEGGFKAVAEAVESAVSRVGLERFGAVGDPFDPSVHEALMHSHDDSLDEPTCVQVLFAGYRLGERVLRPARVAVAEPSVEVVREASEEVLDVPGAGPTGEATGAAEGPGPAEGEQPGQARPPGAEGASTS